MWSLEMPLICCLNPSVWKTHSLSGCKDRRKNAGPYPHNFLGCQNKTYGFKLHSLRRPELESWYVVLTLGAKWSKSRTTWMLKQSQTAWTLGWGWTPSLLSGSKKKLHDDKYIPQMAVNKRQRETPSMTRLPYLLTKAAWLANGDPRAAMAKKITLLVASKSWWV